MCVEQNNQWFFLKRLLLIILIFAFAVVICNTLLTGLFVQHVVVPLAESVGGGQIGWTLSHGFTLGAVLGSTDPVSVISFMEQHNAPAVYQTIIGGESLFNDASGRSTQSSMFSICLSLSLSLTFSFSIYIV